MSAVFRSPPVGGARSDLQFIYLPIKKQRKRKLKRGAFVGAAAEFCLVRNRVKLNSYVTVVNSYYFLTL